MVILKHQQQQPYQREVTVVAQGNLVSYEQRLNQSKPCEVEPNKVEQGMATLEQEQQLWRPGVKAEQVFTHDFSFTM